MPTECSQDSLDFGTVEGREVVAAFDGGAITSDAGALLLGQVWYFATAVFCELTATPASRYEGHGPAWVKSGIRQNRKFLQANPQVLKALRA